MRFLGDPLRLAQIVNNLVSNALKFTASGSVRVHARSVPRSADMAELEFSVVDTGIGIPPEKQALLFRPFVQVDASSSRRYGGSGLGLSIVRSLVGCMSGTVALSSEPGIGTAVEVVLPLTIATRDRRSSARTDEPATMAPGSLERLDAVHVLVVDDTSANRLVAAGILKRLGASVQLAENGLEAVRLIEAGADFDLVFMDCQMPVMDGFEATRSIRRWERGSRRRELHIVAVSAATFENDRVMALASGMNAFVPKPLSMAAVSELLVRWRGPLPSGGQPTQARPEGASAGGDEDLGANDGGAPNASGQVSGIDASRS